MCSRALVPPAGRKPAAEIQASLEAELPLDMWHKVGLWSSLAVCGSSHTPPPGMWSLLQVLALQPSLPLR